MKLDTDLTPFTKINSKWIRDLNVKCKTGGFPGGSVVKNLPANAGDARVRALVWEDPTCCGAAGPVSHNY